VKNIEERVSVLRYDPARGKAFWTAIRKIEGYPENNRGDLIGPMLFRSDSLFELPGVLHQLGASPAHPLLVVMDQTPMWRGRESLKPLLLGVLEEAGWKPEPLILKPDTGKRVRTDLKQINAVAARLREKAAVISLGSGSITDIVKGACHAFEKTTGHRPIYVAYPTANSMGAYTSNVATVFIRGVKRSLPSRLPDALVYDLETLRDAPHTMTVAGIGDMIACFVSFADWLIANRLGMDSTFSEFQQILMGPFDRIFLEHADLIREGAPEGLSLQARFIAAAGIGGSLLDASTPLSGYEHVISHLIDQQIEYSGGDPAFHGTQVALSTLLVSETYRRFLADFNPKEVDIDRCYPTADVMKGRIESAFAALDSTGEAAAECWTEYQIKLDAWHANRSFFEGFLAGWPEIRSRIEQYLRPPELIARILARLDSPLSFDELEPPVSEEQVRFAFLNAPLIRRRATLGDLLVFLDWDHAAIWEQTWSASRTVIESAKRHRNRS
jgi:glycerol-1-phosphate dehydrogenase [NAD(P)+]